MIGNFFETTMQAPIEALCQKYQVYLDKIGSRKARASKKLSWEDIYGSTHDLDYVIERNGTDNQIGDPIAFIEVAWRRYTKHSKNKAQEIAGSVLPIAEKYKDYAPFKGAILSGIFTEPALQQLRAEGFQVLYIPYDNIVASFQKFEIDIAYDENTKEKDFSKKVKEFKHCKNLQAISDELINSNQETINGFLSALETTLKRQIKYIYVLPLHGMEARFADTQQAIAYLNEYTTLPLKASIISYVIGIVFNDGSQINSQFKDKQMAEDFLHRNANYNMHTP